MTARRVVAVTGATGFLGRHIVAALVHAGARPRLLVRREPDFGAGIETVLGSLEDPAALAALTAGAAAIVHAAGLIKAASTAAFLRANRDGTKAIAAASRRQAPEARFILVSSLAARSPGLSSYAASKRAGEEMARAAYADAPDRLVILRPSAIYGPGDPETLPIFKAANSGYAPAFGSSHARYTCIHAADAAAAIARLAMGAGVAGSYGLADGNPAGYRLGEIMAEAARVTGAPRLRAVPIPAALLRAAGHYSGLLATLRRRPTIFTAGKAREMLHPDWSIQPNEALPCEIYQPQITLPAGFQETAAWYRANGWLK